MKRCAAILVLLVVCGCRRDESSQRSGLPTASVPLSSTQAIIPPPEPGPMLEVEGIESLTHKPLCAMTVMRPRGGGDTTYLPRFVLYEDGMVLYTRRGSDGDLDRRAQLTKAKAKALVASLATKAFFELPYRLGKPGPFDYEQVEIGLRHEGRWKMTVAPRRPDLPRAFGTVLDRLAAFDHGTAQPWVPKQIRLALSETSKQHSSVGWPKGVPLPTGSIKPGKGTHHHMLPGRHEATIRKLVATGKAVLLAGQGYQLRYQRVLPEGSFISDVRRTFRDWDVRRSKEQSGP